MKSEQRSQAFLRKKSNDARITVTGNTLFNNGILGPGAVELEARIKILFKQQG